MSEGPKLMFVVTGLVALILVWIGIQHRFDEDHPESLGHRAARTDTGSRAAARDSRPSSARGERQTARARETAPRNSIARHDDRQHRAADRPAIPPRRHSDTDGIEENPASPDVVSGLTSDRPATGPDSGAGHAAPSSGGSRPPARQQRSGTSSAPAQAAGEGDSPADPGGEKPTPFVPGPADLKPFADLTGAQLGQRVMEGLDLQGADFTDANLSQTNLQDASLDQAIFTNTDLTRSDMRRSNLTDADLHDARMDQADLRGAELRGTDLSDSTLTKTNFGGVSFFGADLSGADLRGAMLFGTDFRNTDLDGADFANADLRDANLNDVDISNVENLSCEQLVLARGWQSSIRGEDLACGAPLPGEIGAGEGADN